MKRNRCHITAIADHRDHLTPKSHLAARNHGGKQSPANASVARVSVNVDRILDRVPIGGAGPIQSRVAITHNSAVDFCHKVWQAVAEHAVPA